MKYIKAYAIFFFYTQLICMQIPNPLFNIQEAKKEMQTLNAQLNKPLQTGAQGSIPTLKSLATHAAIKDFDKQLPRNYLQPDKISLKTIGVVSRMWDQWLKLRSDKKIPPGVLQILVDEFAQANRWHLPTKFFANYRVNHDYYYEKKIQRRIIALPILFTAITPNNNFIFFDNNKQIECLRLQEVPGTYSRISAERRLPHDSTIKTMCLTPHNTLVSSDENNFYIWDLNCGRGKELKKKLPKLVQEYSCYTTLSPDGTYAYVYNHEPKYNLLYNLITGRAYPCQCFGIYSTFTSDNRYLITEHPSGSLSVFRIHYPGKLTFQHHLTTHRRICISALTASKNIVACGTTDGLIRGWNLSKPDKQAFNLLMPSNSRSYIPFCLSILISSDERYLFATSIDKTTYVWDLDNQKNFLLHAKNCEEMCPSPDETLLTLFNNDGSFNLFKREIPSYSSIAAVLFDMILYLISRNPILYQKQLTKLCSSCWYDRLPKSHKKIVINRLKNYKCTSLALYLEQKLQSVTQ